MALSQINNYSVGDNNFTSFQETLDATRRGMAEITLSNYDNDSAPVVKVGSVFENNGAFFQVTTSDITPTGYSGISNSTTFYLYFDESATAFIYSSTAPAWNDARQGWYNVDDRAFFSMFKDSGGTLYQDKVFLISKNNYSFSNDITTQGEINADGEINANSNVNVSGVMKWKRYYSATSTTENSVFDSITSWVPTTGDSLVTHGQIEIATYNLGVSGIYRESSSVIRLSLLDTTGGAISVPSFKTITNGSGSAISRIDIMSNFEIS